MPTWFRPNEVDQVAVDRAVHGRRGNAILNYSERVTAVRALAARNYSDQEIAQAIGVVRRTVTRIRFTWAIPGLPVGSNGYTRQFVNVKEMA